MIIHQKAALMSGHFGIHQISHKRLHQRVHMETIHSHLAQMEEIDKIFTLRATEKSTLMLPEKKRTTKICVTIRKKYLKKWGLLVI